MPVKIAKEFRWEMGHRLPGHPLCQNVHGHSYRLVVEAEGEPDEHGMVVDFGEVACHVKPILEQLDHSFMVDADDALMLGFLDGSRLKTTPVPFRSTAENIASWIADRVAPDLLARSNVATVSFTVHETSTSSATATRARA